MVNPCTMTFARVAVIATMLCLVACGPNSRASTGTDIAGVMPALAFHMNRANDGKPVDASDYHGKVVLLYFGYTNCPDICPTTLSDLSDAIAQLGRQSNNVRVLFVTVDPARDSLSRLKGYVTSFSPQIDGLRGSDNAIASLARRYRVSYAVHPAEDGHAYQVEHSSAVFLFDKQGRARWVITKTDDAKALLADIGQVFDN